MSFIDPIDGSGSNLGIFQSLSSIKKDTHLVQGVTNTEPGTIGGTAIEGVEKTLAYKQADRGVTPLDEANPLDVKHNLTKGGIIDIEV